MSQSLEVSPTLYKSLFEASAETLLVVNKEGKIVLVNPRIEKMLGYTQKEALGKEIEELIPVNLREIHKQHRQKYLQSPKDRPMGIGLELYALGKNGKKIPVEISLNHFTYEGQFYVMALLTDISQRKEAQNELKKINNELEKIIQERSRRLSKTQYIYRLIARNFPNGIISVIDQDYDYVFVEGQDLFKSGITSDKLIGTNYIQAIPTRLRTKIKQQLNKVFNGDNQSFEIKYEKGTYLINAVGLKNEKGKIDQILIVEQNITKQKLAEEQAKELLEKERALNELKSRFVSMASHEFRTPLSTILSSANLIKRYTSSEEQPKREKHIERIEKAVNNLTEILEDFLSINRLEEGNMKLKYTPVNITECIDEVIEEMNLHLKQGQQIIFPKHEMENIIIQIDKHILRNILYNLFSNAIKYTPEGKNITLQIHQQKNTITISIKDQGIGIPKEEQKNLFKRFFRAKNAINFKGTGLGLYITKKYVELLNGNITFESIENKGTTFTITIPCHEN